MPKSNQSQAKMTAVSASASGRKDGGGGDADNNNVNATTASSSARPPLVRRSSSSAGSAPGGGGSPNLGPQVDTSDKSGPQHRSTPSTSADLPPLHPAATTTNGNHRSNQPSVDTAAGNETLGNETLDSAYIATALAESTSAIQQTHGIAFHDDDSSMGSVVFHYGLGNAPPNGDYDMPPRNIAGNRGRAGTAGTVDSGLTADGALDRSNHRLTATNTAGNGAGTTAKEVQEHKQHKEMPFRQYLPGGHQHQKNQPPQGHQHQKRWGSEMGINQTPSADYVERGKSSSLTSSGNGSEGVGANDDDEAGRVMPYNVRLSQREGGPQVPPPPPPPVNMSPMRKPPLSPAKTRGAVTIPKTPPSDFSSLSASTYTTLGTRSGTGLRGMEYAELPGDRSPATMASGDVPPIPGLGVDSRTDAPPFNVPKMKQPRSPLSRKRRDSSSAGSKGDSHSGWFNKLAHKMRGGSKPNNTGSYGSIEDPALAKEAKRYHAKNQAFLKKTEWHRKMQRSGNMEQAAVMAAGSNHSRTRTDFSGALDSIASISSDEITDDEERGREEREAQPLMAESKEAEYLRRIRELEDENRRLLRVQAMEAEVHGYGAGYGTLPTAVPITVNVDRTKNDDRAREARVARVSCLAVVFILLVIALLYGIILCVLFLL